MKRFIVISGLALAIFGLTLGGCSAQPPQANSNTAAASQQNIPEGAMSVEGDGGSLAEQNSSNPADYLSEVKETFTELPGDIAKEFLVGNVSGLNGAKGVFSGMNLGIFIYNTDKSSTDVAKELEAYFKNSNYTNIKSEKVNDGEYIITGDKDGKTYSSQVYTKDGKTIVNTMIISG